MEKIFIDVRIWVSENIVLTTIVLACLLCIGGFVLFRYICLLQESRAIKKLFKEDEAIPENIEQLNQILDQRESAYKILNKKGKGK